MALSKTHLASILFAELRKHADPEKAIKNFSELAPYAVLPDAIRCFSFGEEIANNRVVSHFEINPYTHMASGMRFPSVEEIKRLDAEIVSHLLMWVEEDYRQVAIGDQTSIDDFKNHNAGIDPIVYQGCLIHFTQDVIYDDYIREVVDCSHRRENGLFYFNGKEYDAKSVRTLIGQIEECEFRALVTMIFEEFGIIVNQEWFEENVKPSLQNAYCPYMFEKTWGYIKFSEDPIPEWISEQQARGIMSKMVNATIELL